MRLGFIGAGVVGGTTLKWVKEHTNHEVRVFDPAKGFNDSLHECEFIFISVPVPTRPDGSQDKTGLAQSVIKAKTDSPAAKIIIRSTVLPGTCDEFGCYAMPEFLTERTAYQDMLKLPIVTGCLDTKIKEVFPLKKIIFVQNREAEMAKYTHNCFAATKVSFFNVIKEACDQYGCNYAEVLNAASLTGFIESTHTQVPGPDLKNGFGGKCFPKDIDAFSAFLGGASALILGTIQDNIRYRGPGVHVGATNEKVLDLGAML